MDYIQEISHIQIVNFNIKTTLQVIKIYKKYLFLSLCSCLTLKIQSYLSMSKKSSQRQSKQSIINDYEMYTNKKHKLYDNPSEDANNTGYGMTPSTQRKKQIYELASTIHLDQKTTPLKYDSTAIKQSKEQSSLFSSDAIKYRQTLQRLDQTQEKLVLSDKKYGELWRKYQAACESIKSLNKQLSRAQEKPFDLQVKCNLLQKQRDQLKEKLWIRQAQKQRAKDGLSHAGNKVNKLEEKLLELQELMRKVTEQNSIKTQTIQKLQQQLSLGKQNQNKSYERIISTLKQQIELLHSELILKTQELSALSRSIYTNNFAQKHQSSSSSSVSQLHLELSKLHKEKLNLVSGYEQKISAMQQDYKFEIQRLKSQLKDRNDRLSGIQMEIQVKISQKENELKEEMKRLRQHNSHLRKDNDELINKVDNLQLVKQYLQNQMSHFSEQNKKARDEVMECERDRQEIKVLYNELQSIKKEFYIVREELASKQTQVHNSNNQKQQLAKQIKRLQAEIEGYEKVQIEYDKGVKSANEMMLDKIASAQSQRQQMQRQLLAQRLQTIKLKQQLQQQRISLKRQYQLSLQNIKSQLSSKIVSIRQQKNTQIIQKQRIYGQMKQLQRKYQLLASEMLTVNDMMNIATKVHKRYSNFVKK